MGVVTESRKINKILGHCAVIFAIAQLSCCLCPCPWPWLDITPVLRDVLHWLPVSKRTQFKVALLAFDCVRGMGQMYFMCVCVPVSDNTARSSLCSAQRGHMFIPRTWTKLGTRSFRVSAPTVWNSLPTELRSTSVSRDTFKSRMKSHFYADAYLHQVWERSRLRQTMTLTVTLTLTVNTKALVLALTSVSLTPSQRTSVIYRGRIHCVKLHNYQDLYSQSAF